MGLHLVKLCVGVATVEELVDWIAWRRAENRRLKLPDEHKHTTRMTPKRVGELLEGGSLYWVIKGNIQIRQKLLAIRPFVDGEGISRCDLVLDKRAVPTEWQPRRAFQGWRYLPEQDAPCDLATRGGHIAIPAHLRLELSDLGLL